MALHTSKCLTSAVLALLVASAAPAQRVRPGADTARRLGEITVDLHGRPATGFCKWWLDTLWWECSFIGTADRFYRLELQGSITLLPNAQGFRRVLFVIDESDWPEGGSAILRFRGGNITVESTTGMATSLVVTSGIER